MTEEVTQQPELTNNATHETAKETTQESTQGFSWNGFLDGVRAKDQKSAKALEKFSTIDDLAQSYIESQKRISQGFKAPELPKNATEEQVKEYRKAIGVPDAPDGYAFPEGLSVKEEDKPLWGLFNQFALQNNLSQAEFNKVAPAYYAMEAAMREQAEKEFKEVARAQDEDVKAMWGSDAAINMQANEAFLKKQGGVELAQLVLGATSADGKPLGNHPQMAKFLNDVARAYGYSDVMRGGGADAKSIADEKNEIVQRKLQPDYYKRNNQHQVNADQKRFLELISLEEDLSTS